MSFADIDTYELLRSEVLQLRVLVCFWAPSFWRRGESPVIAYEFIFLSLLRRELFYPLLLVLWYWFPFWLFNISSSLSRASLELEVLLSSSLSLSALIFKALIWSPPTWICQPLLDDFLKSLVNYLFGGRKLGTLGSGGISYLWAYFTLKLMNYKLSFT